MKLTKFHWIGIAVALILLVISILFLKQSKAFLFVLGLVAVIGALPFLLSVLTEVGREKEKEDMFLEFSRNLVESVRSGTPISRSIINVKDKDYGSLTPHIRKLANQIALGIPVKQALRVFSDDIGNKVVTRSIALISEAEQAGGAIDTILESVATSVSELEDVKKEQKAAVYNLVMQGYIIFIIFIVIMLVTELKILPMTVGLVSGGEKIGLSGGSLLGSQASALNPRDLSRPFLILLLVQGFFTGLVIGKLSEGNVKSGVKHSFILMVLAWLLTTGGEWIFAPVPAPA